ncbi:S-adenosyl-L-methionine-dependent methyltransferase [Coemansia reversa NRRL 1564]|uniref:S-adenosyl-L-methionine-dependent methyltransferase n=1 Tax=Coemansia reversa (strain ATCC 12441 / NRRL 1564) TaxID=763665 RepID=A0A2G5B365_COERN|nr:S-adenosyl-L-methionine-dependent methyltransferase [Coemansia reversa NRRL 1564]|eukprot:PIA13463.1 S-adenosyl-L-methionine-dependent methyltransferase [Coemansia reversa NRRL 1564]
MGQKPKASTDLKVLPGANAEYGTKDYWQQRYLQEPDEVYDWFKTYADLKSLLGRRIGSKDTRILMLGCGNSTLSGDMYDDGYKDILNIDYSDVVIEQMRQRSRHQHMMRWKVMDVRELALEEGSVDVAIDKGTLDALMCEKGDVWEPSDELCKNVGRMVSEVDRVLASGGMFIWITFGQPHFRKRHLERDSWTVDVERLNNGGFDYFVYVATKPQRCQ